MYKIEKNIRVDNLKPSIYNNIGGVYTNERI